MRPSGSLPGPGAFLVPNLSVPAALPGLRGPRGEKRMAKELSGTNWGKLNNVVSFEEFEQQWLEEIREGNPSTTALGNRFAQKILRDLYDVDDAGAEVILCDGAGDGGIDAAVFLKADPSEGIEGDTWMIVQSKYGSALTGVVTIVVEAQKLFATLEGRNQSFSSLSGELIQRLRNFLQNKGPKDKLEYVLATTRKLTPEENDFLANVRTLGRTKFGECFETAALSIATIYNKVCADEQAGVPKLSVKLKSTVTSSSDTLLIGATPLREVFAFMKEYEKRSGNLDVLYEKNVRKFLGRKRKVNKGIEETLELFPERFGLYNNGITIVAEGFSSGTPGELTLTNPFIVNGCQTTRSIWAVLQRKLNSGGQSPTEAQKTWENRLDQGVVVTKIVVVGAGGEELLTQTTRFTNSQNTVGEKDFIALETDFRKWASAFNSKFKVYLEIQRGAWEAQRAFQRQNPTSEPHFTEAVNAFDLLKVYAAGWLVEPGIAYGKNPPFAPGGSFFDKIVNESGFGIDSLFAAYQLQKLAGEQNFGRGAERQSRGQTRFLFVMVCIELLKDFLLHEQRACDNATVSSAIAKLADADLMATIGDAAVQVIDDYLTAGAEDSIFTEPEFQKTRDLNAFLKSEKLGKGDQFSPNLRTQLALAKKLFRRTAPIERMLQALADVA